MTEQDAPIDWQAIARQRERELKREGDHRNRAEQQLAQVRAECDAIEAEVYGQHDEDDDGKREAVRRIRTAAALDGGQPQASEVPLCGRTEAVSGTLYSPCALPAGHREAYCRNKDGSEFFLARAIGQAREPGPVGEGDRPREQRHRPTHPDGTPYRYHEIVAEGWGHCDGCGLWTTATVSTPHNCQAPVNVAPAEGR